MNEFLAAVIGALAIVIVPAIGWSSQRLTREGRLLIRIGRLGATYALLPESNERSDMEVHLLQAADDLNEWLLPANKTVRLARRAITWGLFIAAIVVLSLITSCLEIRDVAVTIPLGLAAGVVAGLLSLVLGGLAERTMLRTRLDRIRSSPS